MTHSPDATDSIEVAGITLSCRRFGHADRPAVLLLHGAGSRSATWAHLAAALVEAGMHVVAPDMRGHGASTRTADYPLDGFRDDMVALMDALGLHRFAVVGHSLGAHIAALIAQQAPDRISRLVLEEPPVPRPSRWAASGPGYLLALLGLDPRRRYDRRVLFSVIRQLRTPDAHGWCALEAIAAPTLVMAGSRASCRRLEVIARRIADGRMIVIPAGHRVHSRRPEAFAGAVVPFLLQAEDRAGSAA